MDENTLDADVSTIVAEASDRVLGPRAGECLACYVFRQLDEFGCNGTLRFARTFRAMTAPRATALLDRLKTMGVCCCDGEILRNAFTLSDTLWITGSDFGKVIGTRIVAAEPVDLRAEFGVNEPPTAVFYLCCQFVRRGSTQPCGNWARRR